MTASGQIAACAWPRAQGRLSAAFCVIAQSLDTFHNSHTSPLQRNKRSLAHRKRESTAAPMACSGAGVPGPVIHRGVVSGSIKRNPHHHGKAGLRGPTSRYFSKLQEQGVWESVAQRPELPNLTQEKTQRVFKGEGNGTRFVGLRATKQ